MSGLSDLFDLTDDERLALSQELGRVLRIVPLFATPDSEPLPNVRTPADAGRGDFSSEQGDAA